VARVPRRPLSPFLLRKVVTSDVNQGVIAVRAGFPNYPQYYRTLRAPFIAATPLNVERLMKVATIVKFPHSEAFLDEPLRLAERATVLNERGVEQ